MQLPASDLEVDCLLVRLVRARGLAGRVERSLVHLPSLCDVAARFLVTDGGLLLGVDRRKEFGSGLHQRGELARLSLSSQHFVRP